ncbi:hypothetical protein D0Z07_0123 [Hyphodiscus hymeniophilus]|uniref:Uncharacterized protein n=1 Tax=Hyphodiscus hymeniophilus TaxID=353542 RepID=A0A9P6VS65_9HELO|nr:hypothetical protein D0Z07_0123 [Hyphodiscus hymeniophilus]
MNGVESKKNPGSGTFNANKPFGNNPYIQIPPDVDRNPFRLIWIDILSVSQYGRLLPKIVIPLRPYISSKLDELSATWPNIRDILLHTVLILSQLFLIITLPFMTLLYWFVPGFVHIAFYIVFAVSTLIVTRLLNGGPRTECLVGLPQGQAPVNDESELWFFINGIATGENWLQSNLNLLASTFQREIVGIHNPTKGLLFDLIECLIQRDLDYKTQDIRQGRMQIRSALSSPRTEKVVLILHSQGGIEGSSILDWLLADLSHTIVSKLEIFTFGNAARHFNNPLLSASESQCSSTSESHPKTNGGTGGGRGPRVIKYIEHYANKSDFVANIGVLNFTSPQAQPYADGNAFAGHVFVRVGSGHLLNMHYLDAMFTMVNGRVEEGNEFMDSSIGDTNGKEIAADVNGVGGRKKMRLKDISRLWLYRNGGKPKD